jgi:hypothetical protein
VLRSRRNATARIVRIEGGGSTFEGCDSLRIRREFRGCCRLMFCPEAIHVSGAIAVKWAVICILSGFDATPARRRETGFLATAGVDEAAPVLRDATSVVPFFTRIFRVAPRIGGDRRRIVR